METQAIVLDKHSDLKTLKWVAKARAKGMSMRNLDWLCVVQDFICATDGHRLHLAFNNDEIPPGLYEVEKITLKRATLIRQGEAAYPDFWRVIPLRRKKRCKVFTVGGDGPYFPQSLYQVYLKTGSCYNPDYVKDAFSGMAGPVNVEAHDQKGFGKRYGLTRLLVLIDYPIERVAVIMPMTLW